ncbi:hypothetical protein SF123566_7764 [Shigella flexneri 1235-66]|nr:hypothetical protein SF123566_7764 [Shigella flexneri 1235-66]
MAKNSAEARIIFGCIDDINISHVDYTITNMAYRCTISF